LINPRDHLAPIGAAAVLQALLMVAVYFFRQDLAFPRSIFLVYAALNGLLVAGWRLVCRPLMGRYPRRRVLIVGTRDEIPALCRRYDADEVIIVSEVAWQDRLLDALSRSDGDRAQIYVVP